jgi:hypothetical protein
MVADNFLDLSFLVPLGFLEAIPLIMSGIKHLSKDVRLELRLIEDVFLFVEMVVPRC